MKFFFFRLFLFPSLLLLTLTQCGEKPKIPLPGTRLSVMEADFTIHQDPDADNIAIDVIEPSENDAWPQPGCTPCHLQPHGSSPGLNKVIWDTSIGSGNSDARVLTAPLIGAENMIFAMDARNQISALAADTGREIWVYEPPHSSKHIGGGIAYESGFIYGSLADGDIVKLEAKTGKVVWETKLPYTLRGAPTVANGHIYVTSSNNHLIALSIETGETIWVHAALEESLSFVGGASAAATPFVVLAPYSSGELHALHPQSGYSLWSDAIVSLRGLDSKSLIGQLVALPVISKNMAFVISHSDQFIAFDLRTGQRLWEKPIGGIQTPVVREDFLFVLTNNNDVVCLTRGTGRIIWVHSLPIYEQKSETKGRIAWTGPILAGKKLIVASSDRQAVALSVEDGQVLETMALPGPVLVPPIVMQNTLYFLTTTGTVVAVQ